MSASDGGQEQFSICNKLIIKNSNNWTTAVFIQQWLRSSAKNMLTNFLERDLSFKQFRICRARVVGRIAITWSYPPQTTYERPCSTGRHLWWNLARNVKMGFGNKVNQISANQAFTRTVTGTGISSPIVAKFGAVKIRFSFLIQLAYISHGSESLIRPSRVQFLRPNWWGV